jgi:hypothetical protein
MTIVINPKGEVKVAWILSRISQTATYPLPMFWGAIIYYGPVILSFIKGNMNSQNYINTLDGHLNTSYGKTTLETNSFIYG